jgi:hypothetical protein
VIRQFAEAVRALSANPRPENVERYLLASRVLARESSSLLNERRERRAT